LPKTHAGRFSGTSSGWVGLSARLRTSVPPGSFTTSGTGQRVRRLAAGIFGSAKKRSCRTVAPPFADASIDTSGKPGCVIHAFAMRATSLPDASSSARQRSAATVFPSRWRSM
jgi:hypothetical protein